MAIDAVSSISYASYVYPAHKPVGTGEQFSVGESPLRTEGTGAVQASPAVGAVDPAEAERFARDFPQILMQQAFAAPLVETRAPTAVGTAGDAGMDYLWQGDSLRSGVETDAAVEGLADAAAPGEDDGEEEAVTGEETNARGEPMSEEEQVQVQELRNRDREVRAHEQAHQAAGGRYAGGASYEYQQGPDGQRYAVGGEVSIDVSSESTPEATIAKMQQVRAAALAPADPSSQDRSVAAAAQQAELQARGEMREQQAAEREAEQEDVAAADESGEVGGESGEEGEGGVAAVAGDSGAGGGAETDGVEGVSSGGVSVLGSDAFRNAYAAQAGFGGGMTDPVMASAMAYRPIDIVA